MSEHVDPATSDDGNREPVLRTIQPGDRPTVERLWQLYQHDLSEFRGMVPDRDGRLPLGWLPSYFDDPDRRGYLFQKDTGPVGFGFVSGVRTPPVRMAEFFVVRAARRKGVGGSAARQMFMLHPGPWEVAFQEENVAAARFWRRLCAEVSVVVPSEERRGVPGKPHIPPDCWLLLRV